MTKNRVFYMVYVDGNYSTSHKHYDLNSAMMEAHRLCEKEGKKAYVLKSVYGYEPKANPFLLFYEEN